MKVIEYRTATAPDWAALDAEVNRLLVQGYQLYGNPYCGGQNPGAFTAAQALIKNGLRDPAPTIEPSAIAP